MQIQPPRIGAPASGTARSRQAESRPAAPQNALGCESNQQQPCCGWPFRLDGDLAGQSSTWLTAASPKMPAVGEQEIQRSIQNVQVANMVLMKTTTLMLVLVLTIHNTLANQVGIEGKVTGYGVLKVPEAHATESEPQTPAGVANIYHSMPSITTATNRIQAKLGTAFGMIYEISKPEAKDGDVADLEVVMSFPPMAKPDGSTSRGFSHFVKSPYKNHKTWGWVDYSFDNDFELVPGLWRFEVRVGGKTLCSQEFTVYRE